MRALAWLLAAAVLFQGACDDKKRDTKTAPADEGVAKAAPTTESFDDVPAALAAGTRRHRPVLVLFWAVWSQRSVEVKRLLSHPKVRSALQKKRFLRAHVDCTRPSPQVERAKKKWQVRTTPTVVLVDSRGRPAGRLDLRITPESLVRQIEATP